MTKLVHVRQDQNHMATTFSFTVSCEETASASASRALTEAHAYVSRLESELTEFRESSAIYRLNHAPTGQRVKLSRAGLELLIRSEQWRQLTCGAFDCAAKSSPRLTPGPQVAWDTATSEAWRLSPGAHIGFGAIGKGYALDGVRLILESHCFRDFLLSAGGSSIILSGFAGPGDPWSWGWSWTRDHDGDSVGLPLQHTSGAAISIGVSGTHEKGRHLLDSRALAGTPSGATNLSALVAAPSAADADALSTALFVAGYEETASFLQDLPLVPALACIDSQGVPRWNGIFQNYWGEPATKNGARPHASASILRGASLLAAAALLSFASPARADDPAAAQPAPPTPATALFETGASPTPLDPAAAAALFATHASPVPLEAAATPVPNATDATTTAAGTTSDAAPASGGDDGVVDLGGMSANTFTPYLTERTGAWAFLPLFALALVLLHLKKNRRLPVKAAMKDTQPASPTTLSLLLCSALLWGVTEQAHAVDLVPLGTALQGVLGTKSAFKKTVGDSTVFYSKNSAGKADKVAFIEKNIWQKSCTHTWIVGIGHDGKVVKVIAQEQQCPHAKPAAAASFLDQYVGKGPADVAKLKGDVSTIAKATGSCELATDAVIHSITTYQKIKGKM